MKKMIILAVICISGALYGAAAPQKVGIKNYEKQKALALAYRTGQSQLYTLLGGKGPINNPQQPISQYEIDTVLWPTLVWAIEEGKLDLTKVLLGIIGTDTKKPYGKAVTPYEIAQYHNQKDILDYINSSKKGGQPQLNLITEEDPYLILGVSPTASAQEIRRAYLVLLKKNHPDKSLDQKDIAEANTKKITEAFRMLTSK